MHSDQQPVVHLHEKYPITTLPALIAIAGQSGASAPDFEVLKIQYQAPLPWYRMCQIFNQLSGYLTGPGPTTDLLDAGVINGHHHHILVRRSRPPDTKRVLHPVIKLLQRPVGPDDTSHKGNQRGNQTKGCKSDVFHT
jgi:hypothetical protein